MDDYPRYDVYDIPIVWETIKPIHLAVLQACEAMGQSNTHSATLEWEKVAGLLPSNVEDFPVEEVLKNVSTDIENVPQILDTYFHRYGIRETLKRLGRLSYGNVSSTCTHFYGESYWRSSQLQNISTLQPPVSEDDFLWVRCIDDKGGEGMHRITIRKNGISRHHLGQYMRALYHIRDDYDLDFRGQCGPYECPILLFLICHRWKLSWLLMGVPGHKDGMDVFLRNNTLRPDTTANGCPKCHSRRFFCTIVIVHKNPLAKQECHDCGRLFHAFYGY